MAEFPRSGGVLLHPTSLPGPYGIGSFNRAAYEFVDFLARAGQKLWQLLPMGPTSYGDSPYQSFSSFAGNPYLIALETMVAEGLLDAAALADPPAFTAPGVDYCQMYEWKLPLLLRAAGEFERRANHAQKADFQFFCAEQAAWLEDFALFMALKNAHGGKAWNEWEPELRDRSLRYFLESMEFAVECGAPALLVTAGGGYRDEPAHQALERCVDSMGILCDRARKLGIDL